VKIGLYVSPIEYVINIVDDEIPDGVIEGDGDSVRVFLSD
jgi:hypothetical protein